MENIEEQFEHVLNTISLFKIQLTDLQKQLKNIEKTVKKEIKKTVVTKTSKMPSGFAKPTKVTDELCAFMNKTEGSEIARTDVTKALIEYINKNNLQFSENKKIIIPDEKLKTLLGINEGDELSYFTLQKYMNKHFIKQEIEKVAELEC
jgi:DNA topoisomerase-1